MLSEQNKQQLTKLLESINKSGTRDLDPHAAKQVLKQNIDAITDASDLVFITTQLKKSLRDWNSAQVALIGLDSDSMFTAKIKGLLQTSTDPNMILSAYKLATDPSLKSLLTDSAGSLAAMALKRMDAIKNSINPLKKELESLSQTPTTKDATTVVQAIEEDSKAPTNATNIEQQTKSLNLLKKIQQRFAAHKTKKQTSKETDAYLKEIKPTISKHSDDSDLMDFEVFDKAANEYLTTIPDTTARPSDPHKPSRFQALKQALARLSSNSPKTPKDIRQVRGIVWHDNDEQPTVAIPTNPLQFHAKNKAPLPSDEQEQYPTINVEKYPRLNKAYSKFRDAVDSVKLKLRTNHQNQNNDTPSTVRIITPNLVKMVREDEAAEKRAAKAEQQKEAKALKTAVIDVEKSLAENKKAIKDSAKIAIKEIRKAKNQTEVEMAIKKFEKTSSAAKLAHTSYPLPEDNKTLLEAFAKTAAKLGKLADQFTDDVEKTIKSQEAKLAKIENDNRSIFINNTFQPNNSDKLFRTITSQLNLNELNLEGLNLGSTGKNKVEYVYNRSGNDVTLTANVSNGPRNTAIPLLNIIDNKVEFPPKSALKKYETAYGSEMIDTLSKVQKYLFKEVVKATSKSTAKFEGLTKKQFVTELKDMLENYSDNPLSSKFKVSKRNNPDVAEELKEVCKTLDTRRKEHKKHNKKPH